MHLCLIDCIHLSEVLVIGFFPAWPNLFYVDRALKIVWHFIVDLLMLSFPPKQVPIKITTSKHNEFLPKDPHVSEERMTLFEGLEKWDALVDCFLGDSGEVSAEGCEDWID